MTEQNGVGRSSATDELRAYKTKVVLNLQSTSLVYFSPENSEAVIRQLTGGHPVFLQTFDGHCVIVNPNQIPATEVYAE